jgi:gliding motility-associated-like protein
LWNTEETTHSITVNKPGTYWVDVFNGECHTIDSIDVTIEYKEPETIIPNVFTPNGDGFNEELIFQLPATETYDLKIFNRWGNLIFESSDPTVNWKGEDFPEGNYMYILIYKKLCGLQETITEKGTITLLR